WTDGARVRIRIYDGGHARPVVIATEPNDNHGTSVTNMAEYLAAEVLQQHFRDPQDARRQPLFIEHYPPRTYGNTTRYETFDLVTFALAEPRAVRVGGIWRLSLGAPSWRHLDKQQVERLVGQSIH